jgi:hypothetical protein
MSRQCTSRIEFLHFEATTGFAADEPSDEDASKHP